MNRTAIRCSAALRGGRLCGLPAAHKLPHHSVESLANGAARRALYAWEYKLRNLFGITPGRYAEMLAEQGYVCAICHQPERAKHPEDADEVTRLAVDHDHATGEVRGLLCRGCNTALAWFERVGAESVNAYLGDAL